MIKIQGHTCKQVRQCDDFLSPMKHYDGGWVGVRHQAQHQVCTLLGSGPVKISDLLGHAGSVKLIPTKKQPDGCTWDELFDSNVIPPPCPHHLRPKRV